VVSLNLAHPVHTYMKFITRCIVEYGSNQTIRRRQDVGLCRSPRLSWHCSDWCWKKTTTEVAERSTAFDTIERLSLRPSPKYGYQQRCGQIWSKTELTPLSLFGDLKTAIWSQLEPCICCVQHDDYFRFRPPSFSAILNNWNPRPVLFALQPGQFSCSYSDHEVSHFIVGIAITRRPDRTVEFYL